MDPTNDRSESVPTAVAAALFLAIVTLVGLDVMDDLREGGTVGHVAVEMVVMSIALAGLIWMGLRFRRLALAIRESKANAHELREKAEVSRREAERWRKEASALVAGLAAAIDAQLDQWALSPAEKEVALLLLKGLSHKEIGEVRKVGEATVRQQARALYRKAGLEGRHDLAAFFLEDLLGPRVTHPAGPDTGQ